MPRRQPTVQANEALINTNEDCQRTALLGFLNTQARHGREPSRSSIRSRPLHCSRKFDVAANAEQHRLSGSWNFNHSSKENETFDVATYGTSANGIEGDPARINVVNLNWFTTLSQRMLNEAHFTYSRESRPRTAVDSNLQADTGMGFGPTFRFGNPFFLQPNVDELIWRTQFKDNLSHRPRASTRMKFGGEWMHTLNDQVFRGFFTGRYLFDSVTGFLRYASPAAAGGFGPNTVGCPNGVYVTAPASCPARDHADRRAAAPLSAGRRPERPATDAAGASKITNDEFSLFVQDQWQPTTEPDRQLRVRWDAQLMPETVDPRTTAYGAFLDDPAFPSDGTIPISGPCSSRASAWRGTSTATARSSCAAAPACIQRGRTCCRRSARSRRTGCSSRSLFANTANLTAFGAPTPAWPGLLTPAPVPAGQFPLFSGVRVFHNGLQEPARVLRSTWPTNRSWCPTGPATSTSRGPKARNLTRFLNYNRSGPSCCDLGPGTGNTYVYSGAPWGPQLGEVMVANSFGESRYRGLTFGDPQALRRAAISSKPTTSLAKDEDNDSNERDPFTDRSFNFFDLDTDWGPSDRDIRHKVNAFGYFSVPRRHSAQHADPGTHAQPITASPRSLNGTIADATANGRTTRSSRSTGGWRAPSASATLPAHADHRDVQHVQQREQHQPAEHAGAVRLLRIPADRRRRSAAGAAGGEVRVLAAAG